MTALEDQLADLNDRASSLLTGHPRPDGLPATGSWIRAVTVDDDLRAAPVTPWHYVVGWDGHLGVLSTRCRRRPGSNLSAAVAAHIGDKPWWRRDRVRLELAAVRPRRRACRQCDLGLARDAAAVTAAERAATTARYLEVMPAVEAIAVDQAIDDDERGRRLRDLWMHTA